MSRLRAFEPEAIGGEMEGAWKLYVACAYEKVDWLLVKAICDWADGQKCTDTDEQPGARGEECSRVHAPRPAVWRRSTGVRCAALGDWREAAPRKWSHHPSRRVRYSARRRAAQRRRTNRQRA